MRTILLTLCLIGLTSLAEARDYIAPRGTQYVRQNIFGGHDYYNRQGKIGWNRKSNIGDKYYNRNNMYMQSNNTRIFITPNIKWLE